MNFNNLLSDAGIDKSQVIVMRHRPSEPQLNKVLPWLAAERPEIYNAYQQAQNPLVEKAMTKAKYVASFIRRKAGTALFIGLYEIKGWEKHSTVDLNRHPLMAQLYRLGMSEEQILRDDVHLFDLELTDFRSEWKGKLVIRWPPPERSWWRWCDRNSFSIEAILEESDLQRALPDWDEIDLTWEELKVIPSNLRSALREWRGIYFIFDASDGKGYVGSAYGESNILGRWENYGKTGHGQNKHLKSRSPENFRFTILQRLSPDLSADEVIRIEATWKRRLHTQQPFGLNEN